MASSEDLSGIYTTDTIIDDPKAKVLYKGLIIIHSRHGQDTITNEAKKKAKELNANAIQGVRITEAAAGSTNFNRFTFIGTAVHVSKLRK